MVVTLKAEGQDIEYKLVDGIDYTSMAKKISDIFRELGYAASIGFDRSTTQDGQVEVVFDASLGEIAEEKLLSIDQYTQDIEMRDTNSKVNVSFVDETLFEGYFGYFKKTVYGNESPTNMAETANNRITVYRNEIQKEGENLNAVLTDELGHIVFYRYFGEELMNNREFWRHNLKIPILPDNQYMKNDLYEAFSITFSFCHHSGSIKEKIRVIHEFMQSSRYSVSVVFIDNAFHDYMVNELGLELPEVQHPHEFIDMLIKIDEKEGNDYEHTQKAFELAEKQLFEHMEQEREKFS